MFHALGDDSRRAMVEPLSRDPAHRACRRLIRPSLQIAGAC